MSAPRGKADIAKSARQNTSSSIRTILVAGRKTRGGLIGREISMQRIPYHRYCGPEEMRLENGPPFANMFMIRSLGRAVLPLLLSRANE
jgi:hypothetical protein